MFRRIVGDIEAERQASMAIFHRSQIGNATVRITFRLYESVQSRANAADLIRNRPDLLGDRAHWLAPADLGVTGPGDRLRNVKICELVAAPEIDDVLLHPQTRLADVACAEPIVHLLMRKHQPLA